MRLLIEVEEHGISQQEVCKEVAAEAVVRISMRPGYGRCVQCGHGDFVQHGRLGGPGQRAIQVQ